MVQRLVIRFVTVILLIAAAWAFYRFEIKAPVQPEKSTQTILSETERKAIVAELAEDAESEEDMVYVYVAMRRVMETGLTAESIFATYRLLRAPSDESSKALPRDPDFVRGKGETGIWWPGRDAAKARYARAQLLVERIIDKGDVSYLKGKKSVLGCVTKVIRVWSWFGVGVNTSGTNEVKMKEEMLSTGDGYYQNPVTKTQFFCPDSSRSQLITDRVAARAKSR